MKILVLIALLLVGARSAVMAQGPPPIRREGALLQQPGYGRRYARPTVTGLAQMVVTGQVFRVDKDGARPFVQATVAAERAKGQLVATTKTDASGNYSLTIPEAVLATLPDSVLVTANAMMFTSQTIKVKKGATAVAVFHLQMVSMTTKSGHINPPPPPPPPPAPGPPPPTPGTREQAFWPPPQCSTLKVLDKRFFASAQTLSDVNDILISALDAATYDDSRYYYAPNGFVLITRIEQTDGEGRPLPGKARWSIKVPTGVKSLASYLKALFIPPSGHFRIIAFAVTDMPIAHFRTAPSEAEALKWLDLGADALSPKVGALPYGPNYHCTALIYEFEGANSGAGDPVVPGNLSARQHLANSHIAAHLPQIQP